MHKLQMPNSKLQRNRKHQISMRRVASDNAGCGGVEAGVEDCDERCSSPRPSPQTEFEERARQSRLEQLFVTGGPEVDLLRETRNSATETVALPILD